MPRQLLLVYNADGGLWGEFSYLARKIFRGPSCSLCDITHRSRGERQEWKDCRASIGAQIQQLHRNELGAEALAAAQGQFPCVIEKTGERYLRIIGPDRLIECAGDVASFAKILQRSLQERA